MTLQEKRADHHTHHWWVFSTTLAEGWLMCLCPCGQHATVHDPTPEEWAWAFHAMAYPYRWLDPTRLTLRHKVPLDEAAVWLHPPEGQSQFCHCCDVPAPMPLCAECFGRIQQS